MAPLILHNVPEEELYVGDDGIQRPYAMVFPQPNLLPSSSSQNISQAHDEGAAPSQTRFLKPQEPTEVVLRGYRSAQQQYAAINHYEQLAGRICEDYPREPPVESRRYKSELRDPAFTRRRALTTEERAKVNKADGGEHWVKVTFESAEAADAALFASPQKILGHLVYAEPYLGMPPTRDEAIADPVTMGSFGTRRTTSLRRPSQPLTGFGIPDDWSQTESQISSSRTADTMTVASTVDTAASSSTINGRAVAGATDADLAPATPANDDFCRVIPTVRKAKLLPMEQALLPAPSFTQRIANIIPFLRWFNGAMIGSEIPRTELGEFDWNKASLYWKLMWWLDFLLGLFGGEIRDADKDD
ncbi:hypothetical protein N0V88_003552 [Collariella sp. IMI 366227]|nr:hypothetical protein N0V88_003552 [Collariella sp. IMI 366227]